MGTGSVYRSAAPRKQTCIVSGMSKQIGIPLGLLAPVFVLAWSSGFWIAKLGATVGPVTVLLWRFVLVSVLLWGLVALFRLPTPRSRGSGPDSR